MTATICTHPTAQRFVPWADRRMVDPAQLSNIGGFGPCDLCGTSTVLSWGHRFYRCAECACGLTAAEASEARDWLADAFEDCPADLSDAEIVAAVERHYSGGLAAFVADVR